MSRKRPIAIAFSVLLISVLACSLPAPEEISGGNPATAPANPSGGTNPNPVATSVTGGTNGDPAAATAAMQTQVAALVAATAAAKSALDTAVAQTMAAMPSNTPVFTSTPVFTDTPSVVTVSVSVNTNCRSGPGDPYDLLGILVVGKSAEVVGRGSNGGFWIIRFPDNPSITCWLWNQYATTSGNTGSLPIVTPPPTPTPSANFNVIYSSTTSCKGQWAIKFQITNTGPVTWESIRITATDQSTGKTITSDQDAFARWDGCSLITFPANVKPGQVVIATSEGFPKNPAGHSMSATIRLCSKDGMAGICLDKTINFKD